MHRHWQKTSLIIIIGLIFLFLVSGTILVEPGRGQGGKPGSTPVSGPEKAVEKAVLDELEARGDMILAAVLYETRVQNIRVSGDGQWAAAEIAPFDPQTQMVLPVEPGLAILRRQGGQWKTTLPQDKQWKAWLRLLPTDVMDADAIGGWLEIFESTEILRPEVPLGGYKLPWPYGQTRYVSQSTAHDRWRSDGMDHFAWDFYAISGNAAAMWQVLAARPGKVYMLKDSEPNGCDQTAGCNGNWIVLKDESTSPVTYQLYLHLAQNSIPDELHIGDLVNQGQFIGIADDTGYSTGHHLHFMVHTASYSYWGTAIDITFDDVDINGGRPRILDDKPYCTRPEDVCNSFRSAYVSGNKPDPEPPTGDFTNITNGQHITSSTPVFSGWGADVSSGFGTAQLLAAPQNGTWQVVGPAVSGSPFNITPDLCQSGLPPGPTALGLRLMDTSGFVVDLTGLRWVTLDFACSPPPIPAACIPGAGQAALFDEANYQGTCKLFNPGGFVDSASLSPLGGGRASSILLGAGTRVTLYTKENFSGRAETIISSDSNLADNRIQNNSAYSLFVRSISDLPFGSQPFWPPAGQVILDTNSLTLYWLSNEGDMQYQVELTTPAGATLISPWLNDPWWNLADGQTLKAYGIYSWRVRSRFMESLPGPTVVPKYPNHIYLPLLSLRGVDDVNAGLWSSPAVFIYTNAADTVNIPVTQEYFNQNYGNPAVQNEGLNGHWTRTGEWKWENTVIPPLDGIFFWYGARPDDGEFNYANAHSGSLTTVPITMTSDLPYLRFWYYYDTEIKTGDITRSSTRSWDQRWVQISVNNPPFDPDNLQPFVNLYQLSSEPGGEWQESPLIRLPAVTGQVIRLRFYFDTIDGTADGIAPDNFYQGWFIDDVKIVTAGAGLCTDGQEPDNSPHLASLLSAPSQTVSTARICPEDLDYYAFYGSSGEKISVDINARTLQPASKLDSVVELFDSDGKSVLAYNDDYAGQLDSYLTYQLPRTGLYFIRVHHYDIYDGGNNYYYELKFVRDGDKPQVNWLNLVDGGWVPKSNFPLSVQALDGQSGVDKVEFFMHNSNWSGLTWQSLGQASGSNGNYSLVVDPDTDFGPQANMAFFVRVTDKAGNISVRSVWNLVTDFDLPTANLAQLDEEQQTNVYQLSWSGADATSGLDHFELQRQVDGGAWEDLFTSTLLTTMWDVVPPGHTYAYRMRSVDRAGNASAYQTTTTVVPDAETLCALSPDPGEIDNIFEDASPLPLGQAQSRSFCNPVAETEPDPDWIRVEVQAGEKYWVIANPQPGSPAVPVLALYGADKMPINPTGMLAPAGVTPGAAASLFWIADRDEEVRIRIENADPSVIGAKYSLLVFVERSRIFLPSIGR